MEVKEVAIDRINLRVDKVTSQEWQQIIDGLFYLVRDEKVFDYIIPPEQLGIGDYRHNIHIDVSDDRQGSIYLGFQNNSSRLKANGVYDMKIEFNPNKSTEGTQEVFKLLSGILKGKAVRLIECDIAIDIPYKIQDVYTVNVSGRKCVMYDTTRYFGKRHTDGYLKVYDKAKERREVANMDIGCDLTRIEFTCRPNARDGLGYQKLLKHKVQYDKLYQVGVVEEIDDFAVKCMVLAITSKENVISYKNVPKAYRSILKKALSETADKMNVDVVINSKWKELMESIKQWFFDSAEKNELELIFGKGSERQVTDDEQALFEEFINFRHKKSLTQTPIRS